MKLKSRLILITLTLLFFFVSPLPTFPQERTSAELLNNQPSEKSGEAQKYRSGEEEKERSEEETSKPLNSSTSKSALDEEAREEPFKPTFEVSGYKTINLRSVNIRGNYARFMSDQYYQPGFSMEQKTQVELKGQITEGTKVSASLNDSIPVLPGQSQKLRIGLESKYFGVTFGESNLSFENAEFTLFNKRLAGLSGYVQVGSRGKGQDTGYRIQDTGYRGQGTKEDLPLKIQFLSAKSEGIAEQDEFATDKAKLTYTLTHRPVVVASERVRIDNNYQERDKDYEIDYIQGTITFKSFLEDNQTIYVDYEYSPSASGIFERELLGLRGESRIGKRLFLGTTYLQELDTGGGASLLDINATPILHQLWGIDGRYKLGDLALFSSEFAQSTYNPNTQDYVPIDDMEETPTALRIIDGEKILLWDVNGVEDKDPYNSTLQIKENKEEFKVGSSSLSLTYCLNPSALDNPAFVYAYQRFSPQEVVDWTNRYLRLELWVYGDNQEENLSINLGADKDNYYYYTRVVDFSGWRLISLRIPEDLEEHGELSLESIQQIRIYLDNQTTNSLISGELYIDGIKALERSPLTERWGNIKTDGVSQVLVEGSSQAIEGESSLGLEYSFDEDNPQAYVEVKQIFSTYQNWTNYKELSFFLYGDNNQEEFSLDLGKDEDNYYRYSRIIDFSGWKQITLSLSEDFNQKGEVFLSQIKEIKWTIKSTPEINTYHSSLYIDSLSLSQVSVVRGEAYRFSAQAKLKDLSLGINYKKRGSTFASIGSAFLNLTQENLQANLSYQGRAWTLSSEYSEQTDQGDYKRSTTIHNNSLNIKLGKAAQIRTNFKQRKEKNELPGGELDQIINTTTLGLSHQISYIFISSSYFQEGLKDRLDPSKDLLTLGEGVQLSTVGKKKVSMAFDYNARRQREKAGHQEISQTTTSTLSLKLSPSKRISAEGELNQREVKDLKNKTSTTSTLANFKLEAKPSNKLAGGVKYDVTNTVHTINGVATPVETSNVIYQVKALPTKEISLFTEYRIRDTSSSGGQAAVYESDKTTIEVRYEPKARDRGQDTGYRIQDTGYKIQDTRSKWQSNIKYEVENSSKPDDFDRQVQITTLGLNTSLTPDLTLTLGQKLENNKEVSIRGKTDLLSSTTTLSLAQKINKATQATLGYSTSIRDDKIAGLKTGTYNLVSGMTWTPRERVKLKSEFKTGKTLQGRKNEFNLGFDYNPNKKITITSKLSTIQAKDYSANLFTTEAKVNF